MIRADVELGLLVSVMVIVVACSVSETRTRHDLVLSVDVLRSSRTIVLILLEETRRCWVMSCV